MPDTPLSTIRQLVDGATESVDDREVRFKLRTASQLIDVVEKHHSDLFETVADADDELQETLRDLGYIE